MKSISEQRENIGKAAMTIAAFAFESAAANDLLSNHGSLLNWAERARVVLRRAQANLIVDKAGDACCQRITELLADLPE